MRFSRCCEFGFRSVDGSKRLVPNFREFNYECTYGFWPAPRIFRLGFPLGVDRPGRALSTDEKLNCGVVHPILFGRVFQSSSLLVGS